MGEIHKPTNGFYVVRAKAFYIDEFFAKQNDPKESNLRFPRFGSRAPYVMATILEEAVLLPGHEKCLPAADCPALNVGFATHWDPLHDMGARDLGFERLIPRIVMRALAPTTAGSFHGGIAK